MVLIITILLEHGLLMNLPKNISLVNFLIDDKFHYAIDFISFFITTDAINQKGPWENQDVLVTPEWFIQELREKVSKINWDEARKDVSRFLKPKELTALDVWSKEFFLSRADILATLD
jgi:hypothetical protein